MKTFIDLDTQLAQAHTHQDLLAVMRSFLRGLGFEHFSLFYQIFEVFDHPPTIIYASLSADWLHDYMQNNYFGVDPIVLLATKAQENPRPIFWTVDDGWESYGEETRRFMREVIRDAGFDRGVAIPFSLQRTRGNLNLPVAAGAGWPDIERVTRAAFALSYFHYHVVRVYTGTNADSSLNIKLTSREKNVFELIADGLTSREIAQRLHLAPRTVDAYTTAVQEKFGAENRLQALSKAVSLGLIMPTACYQTLTNVQIICDP